MSKIAPAHLHGLNGPLAQQHAVMEHRLELGNVLSLANVTITPLTRHENVPWKDARDGDYGQSGVIAQLHAVHQLKHEIEIVSIQPILLHVWP